MDDVEDDVEGDAGCSELVVRPDPGHWPLRLGLRNSERRAGSTASFHHVVAPVSHAALLCFSSSARAAVWVVSSKSPPLAREVCAHPVDYVEMVSHAEDDMFYSSSFLARKLLQTSMTKFPCVGESSPR